MYRFLVIFEQGPQSYGAYVPELPGCVAVGASREEAEQNIREAIALHLRGIIEDHEPIPTPTLSAGYVEIDVSSLRAAV